jgi:hypothetical protein
MTATLELFQRLVIRNGDQNILDFGSQITPYQPTGTACAGSPIARPKTITLAPSTSVKIWDWTVDGDFVAFLMTCNGFAWIAEKVDAPTASDGSNNAAAGTAVNYPKSELSCVAPYIRQGMAVPVVPASGGHEDNYSGSAFHASTANGRRYEIWVRNPGTTPVSITYAWSL